MNEEFLRSYFEDSLYFQNPPLKMNKFIDLCKKLGININERELEVYEEKGIFEPIFRTQNVPWDSISNDYQYYSFDSYSKKYLINAYRNKCIFLPSKDNFDKYSNWSSRFEERISNYYSNFQIELIYEIHKNLNISQNILLDLDKNRNHKMNASLQLDWFKSNRKYFDKKLCFLINIQRFYYPRAIHDFEIHRFKGGDENWHHDKRNFSPKSILYDYNYSLENILYFIEEYLHKIEYLMGVSRKGKDWVNLFENLNLNYKEELSNQFGLVFYYLSIVLMLKFFLIDYLDETGKTATIQNYPNFLEKKDNKYENLFYLINKFKLNYQQNITVFVEGKSEEKILNKLIYWDYGVSPEYLGIQIINFEGVDKLNSTYQQANSLKNLVQKIQKNSKSEVLTNAEHREFNNLIKNLNDVNILFSDWSYYISYNLEKWFIIPFFISDNEGNIKKFLNEGKMIKFRNKQYNIPKDWTYIWGISNNNYPLLGKDFELANFTDLEIKTVLNEIVNEDISISNITSLRNNGLGIKQVQNSKYKDIISRNKVKIVDRLFDNLIVDFEKSKDKRLLNRPIFKLISKIYDLRDLNKSPSTRCEKEELDKELLEILENTI